MELSNKLDQIELKLRQLALKIERLEKAKTTLLEENEALKTKLKKGDSKTLSLEQKLRKTHEVLESKRTNDPGRTQKVRKELERYIKEIDKCIEWLEQGQGQ